MKKYFYVIRSFDRDLVWSRLIYEKVPVWTCLQAQKTHMAISDDLRPLWLPEGSICHFWPKNIKNTIFGKTSKIICEMLDMTIWVLETENIHPKRLFENLSYLNFRKEKKF